MPFVESLAEFKERHGDFVRVNERTLLVADGASCDLDLYFGRLTAVREPPSDEISLLRRRREFLRAKLRDERSKWNNFYGEVLEQLSLHQKYPHYCPPPPPQSEELLEAGRERIKGLELQIAALDVAIHPTDVAAHNREKRREQEAQRQLEITGRRNRLQSLQTS